jgi:hypothetical protein
VSNLWRSPQSHHNRAYGAVLAVSGKHLSCRCVPSTQEVRTGGLEVSETAIGLMGKPTNGVPKRIRD